MRPEWCIALLLLTLSSFITCEGRLQKKAATVLTYNVRLHESLQEPYSTKEERKKNIIRELKRSDADLVCLQEAFIGTDVEEIINGVQNKFPYSFSQIHTDVNDFPAQSQGKRLPPCDYTRLTAYVTCLGRSGCDTVYRPEEVSRCVLLYCATEALELFTEDSQECIDCFTLSSLNLLECAATRPVVGGRQMNIGGLLLLSNRKLDDAAYVPYYPTDKVEDLAAVLCTHFTSTGPGVFIQPDLENKGFTSNSDMNTYETRTLIKRLRGVQPAVILGDFNTGLVFTPQLQPAIPENYVKLLKRFTTRPAVGFTWRNPLNGRRQRSIDHVFVKNLIIRKTKRVFLPKQGNSMSDHVGVQAVVKAV